VYAQKCQVAAASMIREMRSSSESTSHCSLQQSLAWPPRSPDLTPMDFIHIKALIYMSPVESEEDLIASIVEAAATCRYSAHVSVSATSSSSALYRGRWPYS
jgi:hypothetical protein